MKRIPQYKTNVSTLQDTDKLAQKDYRMFSPLFFFTDSFSPFQKDVTIVWVTSQIFLPVDQVGNHFDLGFSFLKLFPQNLNLPFLDLILDLQHVGRIWSFRVLLSCFYHSIKRCFTFVRCDLRLRWLKCVYCIGLWGRG